MSETERPPENLIRMVDTLLEELARQATQPETKPDSFFSQLGDTYQSILQPHSFAILSFGPEAESFLIAERNSAHYSYEKITAELLKNSGFLKGEPSSIRSGTIALIAFPVTNESGLWGAVLVDLPGEKRLDANYSIVAATTQIVGEFIFNQESLRHSEQSNWFKKFFEFSLSNHSSLEINEASAVLANDSRFLLNAERTQVYLARHQRVWLGAVSSVATVEKRSKLMRMAKSLAQSCVRDGKPVLSNHPQIATKQKELLEEYQDISGMNFLACFPLRSPIQPLKSGSRTEAERTESRRTGQRKNIVGAIIVEFPEPPSQIDFVRAAKIVLPHAGLSISNAHTYSTLPFRRSLATLQNLTRIANLSKILIGLILIIVAVLAAITVPADHQVRIKGELRPQVERIVFAPLDAFVEKVFVKEGDVVEKGQPLATLSSPDLTQNQEKLNGELAKLKEHKSSKQILLNQAASGNVGDAQLQTELASEIADIEFQIQSTVNELKFVQSQLAKLEINSPIAGTVVTWNVQQSLDRRPVKWGDPLMKLADEQSPWELRLQAPENKIAYILEAQTNAEDKPLHVSYFFKSRPDRKLKSTIQKMASSTETNEEFGPSVAIRCPIDASQKNRRHGAKVIADIDCGKKSVGYIWTYEFIDTIRRRFVW